VDGKGVVPLFSRGWLPLRRLVSSIFMGSPWILCLHCPSCLTLISETNLPACPEANRDKRRPMSTRFGDRSGLAWSRTTTPRFGFHAMLSLSPTTRTPICHVNTTSPSPILKCASGTSLSPFLKCAYNRPSVHRHRHYSNPSSNLHCHCAIAQAR